MFFGLSSAFGRRRLVLTGYTMRRGSSLVTKPKSGRLVTAQASQVRRRRQPDNMTMQIICFVVGIGVGGMLVYLSPLAK
jgi:hypothetical protein